MNHIQVLKVSLNTFNTQTITLQINQNQTPMVGITWNATRGWCIGYRCEADCCMRKGTNTIIMNWFWYTHALQPIWNEIQVLMCSWIEVNYLSYFLLSVHMFDLVPKRNWTIYLSYRISSYPELWTYIKQLSSWPKLS